MTKNDVRAEEDALKQSTGWVQMAGLTGYLPFRAANFLVGTGQYQFRQVSCWGYIVERLNQPESVSR